MLLNSDGKIEGLVGDYCPDCRRSLISWALAQGAIIPMCKEDLHQLWNNGDMDRLHKIMKEKEIKQ